MTYSEFDGLYKVPNKENKIWRYLEPYKFKYLVENKSIYFTQVDRFSDEFKEGLLTKYDLEGIRRQLKNPNQKNPDKDFEDFCNRRSIINKSVFISCWMAAEKEYDYMWENFLPKLNGVAIKSSVANLQTCFNNSPTEHDIHISETHYFNYNELLGPVNTIRQYSRKPKYFSSEKEIRAILIDTPLYTNKPNHFDVEVQLDNLINEVRISPNANDEYKSKIEKICLINKLNLAR